MPGYTSLGTNLFSAPLETDSFEESTTLNAQNRLIYQNMNIKNNQKFD